jgi:hypothetical protein
LRPKAAAEAQLAPTSGAEFNFARTVQLTPKNEDQRMLKSEIVAIAHLGR